MALKDHASYRSCATMKALAIQFVSCSQLIVQQISVDERTNIKQG